MTLTGEQANAVNARGNVLVMAGAGTGKTRTLVERCLHLLLRERPRVSLDQILVVTFTEAAAAEMRQRIRTRLELEAAQNPGDSHIQEQLALFETAYIGTLHSFCLSLVRQHFYELELDPQLTVMPEEESRLLAEETLEALLQECYRGKRRDSAAVEQLINSHGKGSDAAIRRLVFRLHHYAQTLPSPEAWFDGQLKVFANPQAELWIKWFLLAVGDWVNRHQPDLQQLAITNPLAARCLASLPPPAEAISWQRASELLNAIGELEQPEARNRKELNLSPGAFEEAAFLRTLLPTPDNSDPLSEDWNWVRGSMAALVALARDFGSAFAEAKRDLGSVDFHDLEQHALRLLWDTEKGQPTATAGQWRDRLRFVFVDEYQDINAAQDLILTALSREGGAANRFLVGDVKQSIYRFRLANPRIFQNYAATWREGNARTIPLVENFRSREGILNFVNRVFEVNMRRELGGIEYDDEARLRFGTTEKCQAGKEGEAGPATVEVHLRLKDPDPAGEHEPEPAGALQPFGDVEEAAKEARVIGLRLQQIRAESYPVWDEVKQQFRPVDWRDMAILLRAPAGKSESFAKEFARLGIPLNVERGGFFSSSEICDLLSLLHLLDNPLQDVPVLAALHSPFAALSLDELATIRLAAPRVPFWNALNRFARTADDPNHGIGEPSLVDQSSLRQKASQFIERHARWRRLARQSSLSHCLETILAETQYESWLQLQPRGSRRRANVRQLVVLARQFDQLQRQGLFRFLRFIEAQQEAETEPEVSADNVENSVRLLSIHQSKGLEFPVAVVADLGKRFNLTDTRADIILDEELGLCPLVSPPQVRKRYPSLAHWLAGRRQKRELLGEELRLLYVAMTRGKDLLVLAGSLSRRKFQRDWSADGGHGEAATANCCLDWLAAALSKATPAGLKPGEPQLARTEPVGNCGIHWHLYDSKSEPIPDQPTPGEDASPPAGEFRGVPWAVIRERMAWRYPFAEATREPAKTTVTAIRRRAAAYDEDAALAMPALRLGKPREFKQRKARRPRESGSAMEIGTAHHTFLQWVRFEKTGTIAQLMEEASRLRTEGLLTEEQASALNLDWIKDFWESELGNALQRRPQYVQRELPFTFRVSPADLALLARAHDSIQEPPFTGQVPGDEYVVVQGVADMAVVLPEEIWLIDFKTDNPGKVDQTAAAKYEPQLKLYARALSLIYRRPVTQCWLWFLAAGRGIQIKT